MNTLSGDQRMQKIYCLNCLTANSIERNNCISCGLPLPLKLSIDESLPRPMYPDEGPIGENLQERVDILEDRVANLNKTVEELLKILQEIPSQLSLEVAAVERLNDYLVRADTQEENFDFFWQRKISGYLRFIENRGRFQRRAKLALEQYEGGDAARFQRLLERSQILFYSDQQHKALALLERALRMSPRNHELLYFIGETYLMVRQPEKALELWKHVIELEPKHSRARMMIGILRLISGRMDEARSLLKESIVNPSNSPAPMLALAALEFREGHFGESERYVRSAHQKLETAFGHVLLAVNFNRLEQPRKALKELEKAHDLRPDDKQIMLHLASLYVKLGFTNRARETYRKISTLNPQEDVYRILASKKSRPELLAMVQERNETDDYAMLINSVSDLLIEDLEP